MVKQFFLVVVLLGGQMAWGSEGESSDKGASDPKMLLKPKVRDEKRNGQVDPLNRTTEMPGYVGERPVESVHAHSAISTSKSDQAMVILAEQQFFRVMAEAKRDDNPLAWVANGGMQLAGKLHDKQEDLRASRRGDGSARAKRAATQAPQLPKATSSSSDDSSQS